jgi:tellurite resistance protein TehA-like permease
LKAFSSRRSNAELLRFQTVRVAFTLWGFGLFWLIIAISSIIELARREKIGFNMGWWAFTFPLGVFTTATTQLATELDSKAFRILGTIFSCCVVAFWLYVGAMTLLRSWTGVL